MKSKHRDYEPFQAGETMEEDLGLFEAAVMAPRVQLNFSPIQTVLVVVDQGNATASRSIATEVCARLSAKPVEVTTLVATRILEAARADQAGLILLPVPCGGQVDDQSLGTIADGLLQTSSIPLFCVRDARSEPALSSLFSAILVAISSPDSPSIDSLAWAFRLAAGKNKINILELADRASISEARRLLGDQVESDTIEEATIGRAVTSRLGGLIGAAQQQAKTQGIATHVDFRLGNPVKETIDMAQSLSSNLMIVSRPTDHTSAGFHFAQDLLLATRKCVLVI